MTEVDLSMPLTFGSGNYKQCTPDGEGWEWVDANMPEVQLVLDDTLEEMREYVGSWLDVQEEIQDLVISMQSQGFKGSDFSFPTE